MRYWDLQQRQGRRISRLRSPAERRSFDDDLERSRLSSSRGDSVVVDSREGVRAGVSDRSRGRGLFCECLLSSLILCDQVERQRRGGFGARCPRAVEALLPFIAYWTQFRLECCAVGRRRRWENKRVWLGKVALVSSAHYRPGCALATVALAAGQSSS